MLSQIISTPLLICSRYLLYLTISHYYQYINISILYITQVVWDMTDCISLQTRVSYHAYQKQIIVQ